jgi:transposase
LQFAEVFNAGAFLTSLERLAGKYAGRKVFLIIDNGRCHNLNTAGQQWLAANRQRRSLRRLPPYSPEFNPVELIWKTTRKLTRRNRFCRRTAERDTVLRRTFARCRRNPSLILAHAARFQ